MITFRATISASFTASAHEEIPVQADKPLQVSVPSCMYFSPAISLSMSTLGVTNQVDPAAEFVTMVVSPADALFAASRCLDSSVEQLFHFDFTVEQRFSRPFKRHTNIRF